MTTHHPLIFTGESVRGILDDRKTASRRLVTPANSLVDGRPIGRKGLYGDPNFWERLDWSAARIDPGPSPAGNLGPYWRVPYPPEETVHRIYPRIGAGDLIWVRETWMPESDGTPVYRANGEFLEGWRQCGLRWRSPIHMPKAACRLWLLVEASLPQWLQDITEAQAVAEGIRSIRLPLAGAQGTTVHAMEWPSPICGDNPLAAFTAGWDTINDDRAPWASNPPVWAYMFSRTEAP